MKKKKRAGRYGRDAPVQQQGSPRGGVALTSPDVWRVLCADGYKPVASCPEVQMCIGVYADLIACMPIRLMQNDALGDIRVKNELSRKIDINPCRYMTRMQYMQVLVRALMEKGSQVTVPTYAGPLLRDLLPLPPSQVTFTANGPYDYWIHYQDQTFTPDEALHFVLNPDPDQPWQGRGYAIILRDVVRSLRQANATRQALQESPAPSLIVKVDALTEEFASVQGRRQLREQYLDSSENGEPWFIPAEEFSVEQVKPLTMQDLAIKENLELDKRAVAAMFGIPPFLVGIGNFDLNEFQHFIATRLMAVAREIEQTMTKGLLHREDWYFSMNPRSLYNYALKDLIDAGKEMVDRMALRRNEWRDWLGMPPDPDMVELLALENYIPASRLGDQKKLNDDAKGGDADGERDDPLADQDG